MNNPIQVSVSILCADFSSLDDEIKKIEKSGADMIHIDIMDGHFVPPVTVGPMIVKAIRPLTSLPIDAHLMVEHPEALFNDLVEAGADSVTIHAECYGNLKPECRGFGNFPKEISRLDSIAIKADLARIKELGMNAFVVISPGTEAAVIDGILSDVDGVLVMSVNPGFAHQKFMPVALAKIQHIRERFEGDIAIDGGINNITGAEALKAGANILATASYFFSAEDPRECVNGLKAGTA